MWWGTSLFFSNPPHSKYANIAVCTIFSMITISVLKCKLFNLWNCQQNFKMTHCPEAQWLITSLIININIFLFYTELSYMLCPIRIIMSHIIKMCDSSRSSFFEKTCSSVTLEDVTVLGECCLSGLDSSLNLPPCLGFCFWYSIPVLSRSSFQHSLSEWCWHIGVSFSIITIVFNLFIIRSWFSSENSI